MALNNMKEYRIEKKLSMKDLSFSTGISEGYLYFIENGERNPSIATARKISNVLGKSINDIFFADCKN